MTVVLVAGMAAVGVGGPNATRTGPGASVIVPPVEVTFTRQTYPVSGNGLEQLREQLRTLAQQDIANGGHAQTRSRLEVTYEFERWRIESCSARRPA